MQITRSSRNSNTTYLVRLALAAGCAIALLAFLALPVERASAQAPAPEKIAFERNGAVWIMNADGTNETLLNMYGWDPSFSPDGTKIVYRCGDNDVNNAICIMNADGSEGRVLTDNHRNFDPVWSPDGSKIAFTKEGPYYSHIYLINVDGTGLMKAFPEPSEPERQQSPAWSPDGTKIAYSVDDASNQRHIYVRAAGGTGSAQRVTETGKDDNPSFSPDGTYIVYDTGTAIKRVKANPAVDEQGQRIIETLTIYTGGDTNADPMYSADGTKLAFFYESVQIIEDQYGNRERIYTNGIYVRDVNTGMMSPLLAKKGGDPAFRINPATEPDPDPTPTPTPDPTPDPTPTPVTAEVAVELSAAPATPKLGDNLTYTMNVKNNGPDTATNVLLYFVRPQTATFVSATPTQGVCAPSLGSPLGTQCDLGDIAVGATVNVKVITKPTSAQEVVAQVNILPGTDDPDMSNNHRVSRVTVDDGCADEVTGRVNVQINRPPDKSRGKYPEHTIRVRNDSGRRLNGLVHFVFDGMPSDVSVNDGTYTPRTRCVQPIGTIYKSVGVGQNELVWEPGQVITLKLEFFNPKHELLNYRLRVFTGPDWP
jgi:TolB protein